MHEKPDSQPSDTLLTHGEPPPFRVLYPESTLPVLLICDHASDRIPAVLARLGLGESTRSSHLAVDIGAGALTEYLADSVGATAVLAQYSRLVVDCNRHLLDPSAFLPFGDGIRIPGNQVLDAGQKKWRADAIYEPYHDAIGRQAQRFDDLGVQPNLIAIHSFTPVLDGKVRPWEVGVLWDQDQGLHEHFLQGFRDAGFETGDNEPYSGKAPADYTVDRHGEEAGLACVGIEVRQDLISATAGVVRVGNVLRRIVESLPERRARGPRRITA